jgi:hypothetical protein
MKKYVGTMIMIVFMFLVFPVTAYAQVNQIVPPLSLSLEELFEKATSFIRPAVLITFLFVVIIGGFTRMTAAGNPEQEEKSMKILTAGIIGFIIVAIAPVIVDFVAQILNIPSF